MPTHCSRILKDGTAGVPGPVSMQGRKGGQEGVMSSGPRERREDSQARGGRLAGSMGLGPADAVLPFPSQLVGTRLRLPPPLRKPARLSFSQMDPHHPSPWAAPTSARQRQHLHHPPPTSSVSTGNAAAAAPQQHQAYLPPPPPPHLLQLQHQQHQQQHGQLHQHHSHQQLYHHHHQQQQQLADSSSSQPPHDHFYEPPSLASVSSSSSVTTQGSPLVTPSHSLGNFPGLDQQQQQQSTASSSSSDTHNPNAPSLAKRPLKHPPRGAQACIRCKSRFVPLALFML